MVRAIFFYFVYTQNKRRYFLVHQFVHMFPYILVDENQQNKQYTVYITR